MKDFFNIDKCSEIEVFNLVLNGKLNRFPKRFWSPPNGIVYATNILKHLIEDVLKWSDDEILVQYCVKIFRTYKLNGLLSEVFNSIPFDAINAVYPKKFKPYEFKLAKVPKNYWKSEKNVINAIKDVYECRVGTTRIVCVNL